MQRITIGLFNNTAVAGIGLTAEIGGVTGVDDQWVKDLADYLKDNPPAGLSWDSSTLVSEIVVTDDSRQVTPND